MAQPQRTNELDQHFPVGALLAMGATTTLPIAGATQCNSVTGITEHIRNHAGGLRENNLRYVLIYLGSPYFHEQQQDLLGALESNDQKGPLWAIFQPMTRRTSTAGTGLSEEFTDITTVANSRAVADPLVATVVTDLGDHPSLLAYALDDDVSTVADAENAARNNTVVASLQAQDLYGRPASSMWRNTGYSTLGADCRYILTYEYPCGKTGAGADTPEGDFHRSTFTSIAGANADWVDVIRNRIASLPSGARHMWCLQVHHTNTGAASTRLRAPTDRELRAQFWIAVGEGATGLVWFPFTDYDIGGGGGVQPMLGARASALAVAHSLSDRLKPNIRQKLLGCVAAGGATPFTTSGGGTSGLPVDYGSAYVGSLTHTDGSRYVVLCNRNTSSANVTVSSATLKGDLVSMETGAVYRLGVDAITLAALDGTILEYRPFLGVPVKDVDLTEDIETWWLGHWANPLGSYYIPPADISLHSRTVTVPVGGDLQAYVDANPDNTTFSLAAGGTYGRVRLIERSGLHFVSADSNNKAICRGFDVFGSTHAQQYNTVGTDYGFVQKLYSGTASALTDGGVASIREACRKRFYRQPSRDLIFKDIAFTALPGNSGLVYYQQFDIGGDWQTDHWYANAAIGMRVVQDVLVQGCTITGYTWGSDNAVAGPTNDPQENNTGPTAHPGLIWGNAGIRNVVVRGCTFTLATNASNTGSPYAGFFDGAQGCVFYGNTISGKQNAGSFDFLTNDDYTCDARNPGTIGRLDMRQARQNVVANNTVTPTGTATLVAYSGEQLLVKANTVNVGAGTIPILLSISSKPCRLATNVQRVLYRAGTIVADGNTVTGNVTALLEYDPDTTWSSPGGSPVASTSPFRSTLGPSTVKNNTVSGTVTAWVRDEAGATVASVGGDTVSGNSPMSRAEFIGQVTSIAGAAPLRGWLATSSDTTTSTDPWSGTVWTADATMAGQFTAQGQGVLRAFVSASSRYLTSADAANCSFGNATNDSAFTLLWYGTITNTAAARTLMSKWDTGQSEYLWTISSADLMNMRIYTALSDAVLCLRSSDAAISMGTPHLYGVTYSGVGGAAAGNGLILYEDGSVVASTATNNAAYVAMSDKTAAVEIGSFAAHAGGSFLDGGGGTGLIFAGALSAGVLSSLTDLFSDYFGAP